MGSPPSAFLKQKAIIFLRFFMIMFLCSIPEKPDLRSKQSYVNSSALSYKNSSNISSLEKLNLDGYFSFDNIEHAAKDFGNRYHFHPTAVLYPKSVSDIASTINYIFNMGSTSEITVAARGHGHSLQGQAQAHQGASCGLMFCMRLLTWACTEIMDRLPSSHHRGTLSNAGISGQAFRHGPQINNVYQLEVVTGKGEVITCSEQQNADLFYGVLGGLGQFGIITRARISLEQAPKKVKWIRVLYSEFSKFSRDQEHLMSSENSFDYIEGFVIINRTGLLNNWRSSFSPKDPLQASQFISEGRTFYCMEIAKYFNSDESDLVNQKIEDLLSELSYIPSTLFMSEVSYAEFLDRVHVSEIKLRAKGLWEVSHPWLNLLVPKSKVSEFALEVEQSNIFNNPRRRYFLSGGIPILAVPSSTGKDGLQHILTQNQRILDFCCKPNIGAKQYLPHYDTQEEWQAHFGPQWEVFVQRKSTYDPFAILAPGQRIFKRQ
ncbi:hypothetical protein GH714_035851 [Hevea brasiliensis]|uniref:Cytokinin dehydrogenase 1 FAD/cytokinin binding domain-containing protein n=1 Tax=Hevea brasiliensis TaxID=3981 RepID=A0A6A6M883_HEVBR|nr:hypothetical protein GH714_035851 [Hevea brasiliensis]